MQDEKTPNSSTSKGLQNEVWNGICLPLLPQCLATRWEGHHSLILTPQLTTGTQLQRPTLHRGRSCPRSGCRAGVLPLGAAGADVAANYVGEGGERESSDTSVAGGALLSGGRREADTCSAPPQR